MQSIELSQTAAQKTKDQAQLKVAPAYDSILELAPYQTGKPVEELTREYGISDVVKLASNENPIGCSPQVSWHVILMARVIILSKPCLTSII